MILKRVEISNYKNLKIKWDLTKSGNIVAIVGKNGSGKSNLLEALIALSNVADDSEHIKTSFDGSLELSYDDGEKIIIGKEGLFQQIKINSKNRKTNKSNLFALEVPDFIKISTYDEFAPRNFLSQRKYTKFNIKNISFKSFNELKYGDDFIPLLLFLFSHHKTNYAREILLDVFGIEKISPFTLCINNNIDYNKLKQPTKGYMDIIKEYLQCDNYSEVNNKQMSEEQLGCLVEKFGLENDFFEAIHTLMGPYYNDKAILSIDKLEIIKKGNNILVSDLSDGEKQLIYILAVMLYYTGKNILLLLDEPDIHMYPNLQMSFIDYLRKINDKMNIIITTHSPYIVSSLDKNDVYCIYDGELYSVNFTKGKDYNSLLREIFNTPIRSLDIQNLIDEIYEILNNDKLSTDNIKEIRKLMKILVNYLGEDDTTVIEIKTFLSLRKINYEID